MLFRLWLLAALFIATNAKAQVITDPTQALAARDTLLQQATQLRQQIQARSPFFTTKVRAQRRQVVHGTVELPATARAGASRLQWHQVTRYRRNGRVQEHFYLNTSSQLILEEYRLNGRTLRLHILSQVSGPGGLPARHLGHYLQSGFVVLDRKQYALPYPAN